MNAKTQYICKRTKKYNIFGTEQRKRVRECERDDRKTFYIHPFIYFFFGIFNGFNATDVIRRSYF